MLNYLIDLIFNCIIERPIQNYNKLLIIKFVQKLSANIVNSVKKWNSLLLFISYPFIRISDFSEFSTPMFFHLSKLISQTRVVYL